MSYHILLLELLHDRYSSNCLLNVIWVFNVTFKITEPPKVPTKPMSNGKGQFWVCQLFSGLLWTVVQHRVSCLFYVLWTLTSTCTEHSELCVFWILLQYVVSSSAITQRLGEHLSVKKYQAIEGLAILEMISTIICCNTYFYTGNYNVIKHRGFHEKRYDSMGLENLRCLICMSLKLCDRLKSMVADISFERLIKVESNLQNWSKIWSLTWPLLLR